MRIAPIQKKFIYDYWIEREASNQVYLFGSRADDTKKGGDIDILVLSEEKLHHSELYKMKQSFFLNLENKSWTLSILQPKMIVPLKNIF
jgi:predicted nucleotidyltransferase